MRKFLLRTLMLTLLLASFFTITAFAEDAVVTGSDVNFRSGPGMNYEVLDCLPKGATVTVTDRSNAQWYGVSYNGRSGFISASYLSLVAALPSDEILVDDGGGSATVSAPAQTVPVQTPAQAETPAATAAPAASSTPGYINAMYVRFRSGPSTGDSILGTYNRGTALTITGSSGGWSSVIINGVSGYVYSQYVSQGSASVVTETPAPTPTPAPAPAQTPDEVSIDAPASDPAPAADPAPVADPTPAAVPAGAQAGYICGDYVRFRSGPSTSDTILGTYDRGKKISITGTSGSWTAAVIDGVSGYVYSQYVAYGDPNGSTTVEPTVSVASEPGYINGNNVRLRSAPSTTSTIVGEYNSGTALTITGVTGDWTAVNINGAAGYVYSQYVTRGTISVTPSASTPASATGTQVAELALQYVGYNYVWGGKSPSTGFDCSGLVYYVYSQFGVTLPRVANDQASAGVAVSLEDIQPGDILCFYSGSNYVGHVGIYIGDNKFVHASTSTTGVIISDFTGYYVSRGFVIRRVV